MRPVSRLMGVPPRSTETVVGLNFKAFMQSPGPSGPRWLPQIPGTDPGLLRSLHETRPPSPGPGGGGGLPAEVAAEGEQVKIGRFRIPRILNPAECLGVE